MNFSQNLVSCWNVHSVVTNSPQFTWDFPYSGAEGSMSKEISQPVINRNCCLSYFIDHHIIKEWSVKNLRVKKSFHENPKAHRCSQIRKSTFSLLVSCLRFVDSIRTKGVKLFFQSMFPVPVWIFIWGTCIHGAGPPSLLPLLLISVPSPVTPPPCFLFSFLLYSLNYSCFEFLILEKPSDIATVSDLSQSYGLKVPPLSYKWLKCFLYAEYYSCILHFLFIYSSLVLLRYVCDA